MKIVQDQQDHHLKKKIISNFIKKIEVGLAEWLRG
jgi:hypothetical protein